MFRTTAVLVFHQILSHTCLIKNVVTTSVTNDASTSQYSFCH